MHCIGAKLAHATASRDFCLGDFYRSNSCVRLFVMLQNILKNTISVEPIALIVSLGRSTLPRTRPFLQRSSKACDVCVAGGGLGGRATAMRRRGGEEHNGNDNNDDAAVAADGEDDKRLRR